MKAREQQRRSEECRGRESGAGPGLWAGRWAVRNSQARSRDGPEANPEFRESCMENVSTMGHSAEALGDERPG